MAVSGVSELFRVVVVVNTQHASGWFLHHSGNTRQDRVQKSFVRSDGVVREVHGLSLDGVVLDHINPADVLVVCRVEGHRQHQCF